MHSRTFLHRLSETPRASAAETEPVERHPLGFADVRSTEPATPPVTRRPFGFAQQPEPQFVTEMSFRRAPAGARGPEVVSPARGVDATPADADTAVGHAEVTPGFVIPTAMAADDEKVPFYKRELSLRRRNPQQDETPEAVESLDSEAEVEDDPNPIGFSWNRDPADDHSEPETVEEEPAVETVEPEPVAEVVAASEPAEEAVEPEPVAADEPVAAEADDDLDIQGLEDDGKDAGEESTMPIAETDAPDESPAEVEPEPLPIIPLPSHEEPEAGADGELEENTSSRRSIRAARPKTEKQSGPKGPRSGRRVVGLKVGASQLAAAVVTRTEGQNQLVDLVRTPLEPGIVVDGEVRDADALREALKAFFAEHKLPKKDVRIGVASNRIGVRTFDIAGIDDHERFDNAVRFKAHEVLPVSVHESVLDYRVVDERVSEGGEVIRRVLLVVAPRDQVEPFAAACGAAGVRLGGIDLEALALLRTFVEPQPFSLRTATDTATVVVAIGHESTSLLVSGGGACEFTRVFDWGGSTLQHAIAQELDISEPEANEVLHGLSLSGTSSLPPEQASRALDAVRARLTPFARELVSSLQFYQSQTESLGIGEIVITGGASHLEGLGDALHQMIGVSVRIGDPLQRVQFTGQLDPSLEATIGSLAVPIGLAIEDDAVRSVNLLPPELRAAGRQKPKLINVALPIAAVVPLAAVGLMFMNASADVTDRQGQLDTVQAEISALPEPTRPDIDPSLAVDQQQRAAALATVLGGRVSWDHVLTDLSRALPTSVWLTHFTAKLPEPTPFVAPAAVAPAPASPGAPVTATAPTGVVIEGYTYSLPDVARLLARLNTLPSLTNVVLGTSTKSEIGKRDAISFTINADIASAGGAQ